MLCVFSDASQDAFGTCAYIRQRKYGDKYQVRLTSRILEAIQRTLIGATGRSPRFPSSQDRDRAGVPATIQIRKAFHR